MCPWCILVLLTQAAPHPWALGLNHSARLAAHCWNCASWTLLRDSPPIKKIKYCQNIIFIQTMKREEVVLDELKLLITLVMILISISSLHFMGFKPKSNVCGHFLEFCAQWGWPKLLYECPIGSTGSLQHWLAAIRVQRSMWDPGSVGAWS